MCIHGECTGVSWGRAGLHWCSGNVWRFHCRAPDWSWCTVLLSDQPRRLSSLADLNKTHTCEMHWTLCKQLISCWCLTCGQHDGRVAVVGAADDSSDDDRSVRQVVLGPLVQEGDLSCLLLFGYVEALKTHLHRHGWHKKHTLVLMMSKVLCYQYYFQFNMLICAFTFSFRQLIKSSFMHVTATLSCGRLGPLTWGAIELRFISMTYDTNRITWLNSTWKFYRGTVAKTAPFNSKN